MFAKKRKGNDEAGNDEENIDPNEPTREHVRGVKQDDRENGERSETLNVAPDFARSAHHFTLTARSG